MELHLTHLGGPSVLVELDGWRLLSDPTFDPAGRRYAFGWGTSSRKTTGPARTAEEVGVVDAVLLSHDQHADNLDDAGRAYLADVPVVLTTRRAARRLAHPGARGLAAGESTVLEAPGRRPLRVEGAPGRHGPPVVAALSGPVVGFLLAADEGGVWISGDTVATREVRRFAARAAIDVAVLHGGGVQFRSTGPLRFTMTSGQLVALGDAARPRVVAPVHSEGWSHFRSGPDELRAAIAASSDPTRYRVLVPGERTQV